MRVQTTGWHLNLLNTARGINPAFSARTPVSYPVNYGRNDATLMSAPATPSGNASGTINMLYHIPIAYSDTDLRGAIWANVVNSAMSLQLVINPTPGTTGNSVKNIYSGNTPGAFQRCISVYQEYYDQIPRNQAGGLFFLRLTLITFTASKIRRSLASCQIRKLAFRMPTSEPSSLPFSFTIMVARLIWARIFRTARVAVRLIFSTFRRSFISADAPEYRGRFPARHFLLPLAE